MVLESVHMKQELDPIQTLNQCLLSRKEKNSSYSARAFARDLGISHSLLSLIRSGKRTFTVSQAQRASILLGFSKEEEKKFIESAILNLPKNSKLKNKVIHNISEREANRLEDIELDKLAIIAKWYHLPLLDLMTTKNFKSSTRFMAKRLGITVSEVNEAIHRLKRVGLIEEVDGNLVKSKSRIQFMPQKSEAAVREYHSQMMDKAKETMLQNTDSDSWSKREISGLSLAVDVSKLPEAKAIIQKCKEDLAALLANQNTSEVYQFNIQLFPITRSEP